MATMINCATDWTYDYFVEDAKKYKATCMRGVYPREHASDRERFMIWYQNAARDFYVEWMTDHEHHYDRYDGWIGDAFARRMCDYRAGAEFSDLYKDTYGQRPHLPMWYYVHVLGMPMSEDTARTFCANPIQDAIEAARECRNYF